VFVSYFIRFGYSAGPFVISLFLLVKIDLATDSGSEYDRDKKKIGFHFFLTCVTVVFEEIQDGRHNTRKIDFFAYLCM